MYPRRNTQIQKQKILQGFKGGFLSPAWMKQRAGWFIQLRGFWGIYRVITELYQATTELEKGLSRLQAYSNKSFKKKWV